MPKSKILWLDDDLLFYSSFKNELEENYTVDVAKSPEEFWKYLSGKSSNYYCGIILDVLLPFGTMDVEATNGGLRTGLALLEILRSSEYARMPVIIFTIRENNDVDQIGKKHGATVLRKSEARIAEFIEVIKKEFGG